MSIEYTPEEKNELSQLRAEVFRHRDELNAYYFLKANIDTQLKTIQRKIEEHEHDLQQVWSQIQDFPNNIIERRKAKQ